MYEEILSKCDHTLLKPTAVWSEIKELCDEAVRYGTASVCIPPSYVKRAYEYLDMRVPVCTVIGFPNGYSTSAIKAAEAADAVRNGASEIDMVIDFGALKDGRYMDVERDISIVREACRDQILKVIVETCLLTEEEKIRMCGIVSGSGADFIKTSTGFSTGGATFDDIALFAAHVGEHVRIKAAGGISTIADAERFISLGASRLGTSRIVKLVRELESSKDHEQPAAEA